MAFHPDAHYATPMLIRYIEYQGKAGILTLSGQEEARKLFQEPEVLDSDTVDLKWSNPDEESLVEFMVTQKNFSEERIRNGIKKLMKAKQGTTQGRMDSFFSIVSTAKTTKRKAEETKGPQKKKGKGSFRKGK